MDESQCSGATHENETGLVARNIRMCAVAKDSTGCFLRKGLVSPNTNGCYVT